LHAIVLFNKLLKISTSQETGHIGYNKVSRQKNAMQTKIRLEIQGQREPGHIFKEWTESTICKKNVW
jgi:hypothetical protein